jgi:hypothetical protein
MLIWTQSRKMKYEAAQTVSCLYSPVPRLRLVCTLLHAPHRMAALHPLISAFRTYRGTARRTCQYGARSDQRGLLIGFREPSRSVRSVSPRRVLARYASAPHVRAQREQGASHCVLLNIT